MIVPGRDSGRVSAASNAIYRENSESVKRMTALLKPVYENDHCKLSDPGTASHAIGRAISAYAHEYPRFAAPIVDFDLVKLPGLSCWFGDSFCEVLGSMVTLMLVVLCALPPFKPLSGRYCADAFST